MANNTLSQVLDTKVPKGFTKERLDFFRQLFGEFEKNDFKTVFDSTLTFTDPVSKTVFQNITDLRQFLTSYGVPSTIPDKYYGILIEHWYETLTLRPEYSEPTTTDAPQYKAQSATTITEKEKPELFEEAKRRAEGIVKDKQAQKEAIQTGLDRQREIYEQTQQKIRQNIIDAQKIAPELKDKVLYAKIVVPEIPPVDNEQKKYFEIIKEHIQQNPRQAEQDLEKIIEEKITPGLRGSMSREDIQLLAMRTSAMMVEQINPPEVIYPPIYVQNAILHKLNEDTGTLSAVITDKTALEKLHNSTVLLELEKNQALFRYTAKHVFGEYITANSFGPDPKDIQIALYQTQTEGSDVIYLDALQQAAIQNQQRQFDELQTLRDYTPDAARSYFQSSIRTFVDKKIAALPVNSKIKSVYNSEVFQLVASRYGLTEPFKLTATNMFGESVMYFAPEYAPYLGVINRYTGWNIGVGIVGSRAVTTAAADYAAAATTISYTGGLMANEAFLGGAGGAMQPAAVSTGLKTGLKGLIGKVAIKLGLSTATSASGAAAGGAAAGAVIGNIPGAIIGFLGGLIGGEAISKLFSKLKVWWTKNKDNIAPTVAFLGLVGMVFGGGPLRIISTGIALTFGGIALASGGMRAIGAGIAGTWFILRKLLGSIVVEIGLATIIILVSIPPLVALIMFIINSGAYMVPPAPVGSAIIHIPSGGNLTKCNPSETGEDITHKLASSIRSGSVKYLPNSLGSRQDGICMTPTMIILHTSGGYDNDDGNVRTFETLVQRNVSCQLATDTDDTIFMLSFFEKQVEFAWCADNLNAGGISTEMAGECQKSCAPISKCSPNMSLTYTPNGPHPCTPLEDLSFDAVCKIMKQYKIPWSQVFQHEASSGTHTDPIGNEWVDKFILRLKSNCSI